MNATSTVLPAQTAFSSATRREADCLLEGIFETAASSASLLGHRQLVILNGVLYEIPRFMLLGERGGGRPIRIAVFGGLDAGLLESVAAEACLFSKFEARPGLARDFALIGYPIVNVLGFTSGAFPLRSFEARFASDREHEDVDFFKGEFQNWSFDGIISLRTDLAARGFYSCVPSEVIARDIVQPALATLGVSHPLEDNALRVERGLSECVGGRLAPPPHARPFPFEIQIFAPGEASVEVRVSGLVAAVELFLHHYRECICHGQDL